MENDKNGKMPKVSIVIPTYNRREDVVECIESVLKQEYINYELIVIDNGSTDGTYDSVRIKFPDIKLIRSEENLGGSGGRNLGIKHVSDKSEYILFLDSDVVIENNLLPQIVNIMSNDPRIGIAMPRIYYQDKPTKVQFAISSVDLITGFSYFNTNGNRDRFSKIIETQVVASVFLTKRDVFKKIGVFDEEFFIYYDDTDFCIRAKNAGFRIVCIPSLKAYHKYPSHPLEAKKRWLSGAYYISRNKIIFMKKYSKSFKLFLLLYPAYFTYYIFVALSLKRIDVAKDFVKGTIAGLRWALKKV